MPRKRTISTKSLFEELHIDIEGTKFKLKRATRSIEEEHRDLERAAEEKEDELRDLSDGTREAENKVARELVALQGDLLDIWLEPLGEEGGSAKDVLLAAYDNDDIGISTARELTKQIGDLGQERPT